MAYLSFTLRLISSAVASGVGDILAVFLLQHLRHDSVDRKARERQTSYRFTGTGLERMVRLERGTAWHFHRPSS
jgi:hypothetical protein